MKNILILGGGFGGIHTALNIRKLDRKAKVTIIEKNGYHLFTPSLYELALADDVKDKIFLEDLRKTVAIPYDLILANKDIELIQAEISGMDFVNKLVFTKGGHSINYDQLVIALGCETNDFGIAGVSDYAFTFKSLDSGLGVYKRLEEILINYVDSSSQIHIGIVGGGFTGIELAAEIQIVARKISERHHKTSKCFKTTIYEAGPKIVPFASDKERLIIENRLKSLGIDIVVNSKINEVGPNWLSSNGDKFHSDLVVWTAGTSANRLLKTSGLPINERGRVIVNDRLKVESLDGVYVIGDAAASFCPKTKEPLPMMAYIANAQGKYVAKEIIRGNNKPFDSGHDTWIAPVGGKFSVAHIGSYISFSGYTAWLMRELVDLIYFTKVIPFSEAIKLFITRAKIFSRS